jgi:hypothetical protein
VVEVERDEEAMKKRDLIGGGLDRWRDKSARLSAELTNLYNTSGSERFSMILRDKKGASSSEMFSSVRAAQGERESGSDMDIQDAGGGSAESVVVRKEEASVSSVKLGERGVVDIVIVFESEKTRSKSKGRENDVKLTCPGPRPSPSSPE